jgi:hypothetical protein
MSLFTVFLSLELFVWGCMLLESSLPTLFLQNHPRLAICTRSLESLALCPCLKGCTSSLLKGGLKKQPCTGFTTTSNSYYRRVNSVDETVIRSVFRRDDHILTVWTRCGGTDFVPYLRLYILILLLALQLYLGFHSVASKSITSLNHYL